MMVSTMRQTSTSILLFFVGLIFIACNPKIHGEWGKLPKVKDAVLVQKLDSLSNITYDYFYTKVSTNFKDTNQNVSFKTSIRIVNDSAVNATISYASIPIIHGLVTPDTVKVSNKRENCYVKESLSFFKRQFGVDFNYENIEELIQGRPLAFDSLEEYYQVNDPYNYTISSHKKREIRRLERNAEREIVLYYTLSPDLHKLKSTRVESIDDTTEIVINYISWEEVEGNFVPALVEIEINSPRNRIRIEMDAKKSRINEREEIYFVIPEDYEKCN